MGDYRLPSDKITTPVVLVDENGDVYTAGASVGGATEAAQDEQTALLTTLAGAVKAEDSLHVSGDAGVPALGVRANTPTLLATEGDYVPFLVDAAGALWVSGAQTEDTAHASGDRGRFVLAVRNDAGTALAGTDLDYIGLTTDAQGRLWVAGSQTEDAAHTSGDRGVMALGVRTDTAAARAGTDGDYAPMIFDALNKLWVTGTYLTDAVAGASDQVSPVGAIRDDALAALTPVDGDYDRLRVDKWGRLHVRESLDEYETVAASATDQALGATGATGDILSHVLIVPGTTSPGAVSIKDGAGSAVTIFAGGASSVQSLIPFTVPLGARSTAGAWQITTGANVTVLAFGEFT